MTVPIGPSTPQATRVPVPRRRAEAKKRRPAGNGLVYVEVANQLREQITAGQPAPGERLASEGELSRQFGVSRSTIREALRVLTSQRLIVTNRGATGGSTVLRLDHHGVMEMLHESIRALATFEGCTEPEMEEVREILEVTSAWLAASRRSPTDVAALVSFIPTDARTVPVEQQIEMNKQFHSRIRATGGNRLLHLLTEPVSILLESYFDQREHAPEFWESVVRDHRRIANAIEARDQVEARRAMSEHILNSRRYSRVPAHSTLVGLTFEDV